MKGQVIYYVTGLSLARTFLDRLRLTRCGAHIRKLIEVS